MNRLVWLVLSIIIVFGCNHCKDECDDSTDPNCPNYQEPINPCDGVFATSAQFSMMQSPNINGVPPDTLITFYRECVIMKPITLRAHLNDCSYHWIIGANDYYTQEVSFNFSSTYVDQQIPITLIVSRTPNTACFPEDDGLDTVSKIIIPKYGCEAAIWGKYYGAWEDSPLDSFVIELVNDPNDWPNCGDQVKFINLNPMASDDTCIAGNLRVLYNYIEISETSGSCYWPLGQSFLDSTEQNIKIEYSLIQEIIPNAPRFFHKFRGYRVN
jgi:hypothetical protein